MIKGFSGSLLLLQLLEVFIPVAAKGSKVPIYKNANEPVEKRVEDLLGRMTIEEKMAQLMQGTIKIAFKGLFVFLIVVCYRRHHQLDEPNERCLQL